MRSINWNQWNPESDTPRQPWSCEYLDPEIVAMVSASRGPDRQLESSHLWLLAPCECVLREFLMSDGPAPLRFGGPVSVIAPLGTAGRNARRRSEVASHRVVDLQASSIRT